MSKINLVISSILSFVVLSIIPVSLIYGFLYTYSGWENLFKTNFDSLFKLKTTIITTFIYFVMLFITFKYLINIKIETHDIENDGDDDLKNLNLK